MKKIDAIVYTSKTGFTKEYAILLAEKLSILAYSFKEAKKNLNKDSVIIYLGWNRAGKITNYEKACFRYDVALAICVGMSNYNEYQIKSIRENNNILKGRMFYLQGGFDITRLHGFLKHKMKKRMRLRIERLSKIENKSENELEMLDVALHGHNFVKPENLDPIIVYLNNELED